MTKLSDFPASANRVTLPAKSILFRQGQVCDTFYVLLEGSIRVLARSAAGKEIVLYRVGPGDLCTLTTSCLLSGSRYPSDAIAESEVTAMAMQKTEFNKLVNSSDEFRALVLSSFGERLTSLIVLVEQLALQSIEWRLATFLLEHTGPGNILSTTHQEIANEIGSVREVVSRQLKVFSDQGWIDINRGSITLRDRNALRLLTQIKG
jgi:CRP/FNR family transcriptional regulator